MESIKPKIIIWSTVILGLLFIAALIFFRSSIFLPAEPLGAEKIKISASLYPLAEFAQEIGQDKVEVSALISPGTEPHDFEPTPQDRITIERSSIFIYNGVGFEPWAARIVSDLKSAAALDVSSGLTLINEDPHFLNDPLLAEKVIDAILNKLIEVDQQNRLFYETNAANYKAKLSELDQKFKNGLSACQSRNIVTSHDAFAYLARRYNLNQVPIAGLFQEETSPAQLAQIVDFLKENKIKYVFTEATISTRVAETVAREAGADFLVMSPVEEVTLNDIQEGKDYIGRMERNLSALRTALECQ